MRSPASVPTHPRRVGHLHPSVSRDGGTVHVGRREVTLNRTALALWELCDGETRVDEMVAAVCALFAVAGHQARSDIEAALVELVEAGAVR